MQIEQQVRPARLRPVYAGLLHLLVCCTLLGGGMAAGPALDTLFPIVEPRAVELDVPASGEGSGSRHEVRYEGEDLAITRSSGTVLTNSSFTDDGGSVYIGDAASDTDTTTINGTLILRGGIRILDGQGDLVFQVGAQ